MSAETLTESYNFFLNLLTLYQTSEDFHLVLCKMKIKDVTDNTLKYLKYVKKINLRNCRDITDDGLQYLTNVEIIDLTDCSKITGKGINHLKTVREIIFNR